MSAYIPCPIIANRASKTIVTVTATLMPDARWLVQIKERRTAAMTRMQIHHNPPFPNALSHFAILSWLKAMRTKGMDIAAEIVTVEVSEYELVAE